MFDRIASIAKPYVQRFKKAMNKAIAFVKRNKTYVRTAVGLATIAGGAIVYESLTNTGKEDDWRTKAFDFASNGDVDILIAANSRNGSGRAFTANDHASNVIADGGGISFEI